MVAALDVEIALLGQAVFHHDFEAVRFAKRWDRPRLAIEEERLR